jgi:hypothetical protein
MGFMATSSLAGNDAWALLGGQEVAAILSVEREFHFGSQYSAIPTPQEK